MVVMAHYFGLYQAYLVAPASIRLVMIYCCVIDNTLLTTQYKTSPEGKKAKKTEKTNGNAIMILA
jgi:hypothetical protein